MHSTITKHILQGNFQWKGSIAHPPYYVFYVISATIKIENTEIHKSAKYRDLI